MNIKSTIFMNEKVINKSKHRLADEEYYAAYAVEENGEHVPLLFTDNEIIVAKNRARKNREDILPYAPKTLWQKIKAFLGF